MSLYLTTIILHLLATTPSLCTDYCKLCTDHTMCLYPRDAATTPLSAAEKLVLLEKHNEVRDGVARGVVLMPDVLTTQPRASNMRALTWNDELATVAQRWADQGVDGRDACRDVTDMRVGQNVMTLSDRTGDFSLDPASCVHSWFTQVVHVDARLIQCYDAEEASRRRVDAYTQLVWADTAQVGCGRRVMDRGNGTSVELLVCNYAPAGNIDAVAVYMTGETSASRCPEGLTPNVVYTGLCDVPAQSWRSEIGKMPDRRTYTASKSGKGNINVVQYMFLLTYLVIIKNK